MITYTDFLFKTIWLTIAIVGWIKIIYIAGEML